MSYKKAVAGQIRPGRKEIVPDRRRKKGKLVFPNMDVSENSGFSPQIIHFDRVFSIFSPSILGKPFFLETSYDCSIGGIIQIIATYSIPAWLVSSNGSDCKGILPQNAPV